MHRVSEGNTSLEGEDSGQSSNVDSDAEDRNPEEWLLADMMEFEGQLDDYLQGQLESIDGYCRDIEKIKRVTIRDFESLQDVVRETEAMSEMKNFEDRSAVKQLKMVFENGKDRPIKEDLETLRAQRDEIKFRLAKKQKWIDDFNKSIADEARQLEASEQERLAMLEHIDIYEDIEGRLNVDLAHLFEELKELNNEYQNLIGNIRVIIRMRPFHEGDSLPDRQLAIQCHGRTDMQITIPHGIRSDSHNNFYEYNFEQVYDMSATQDVLFQDLSSLIQSSLDGYNVCIFGYGQTGAGKTHTMIGGEGEQRGLLPRTVSMIFDRIKDLEKVGWKCSVKVCFSEIYNEKMKDLLSDNGQNIADMTLSKIVITQHL